MRIPAFPHIDNFYLILLLQEYPKIRVVTTGAPEYSDGLIGLGFPRLAAQLILDPRKAREWAKSFGLSVRADLKAQTGSENSESAQKRSSDKKDEKMEERLAALAYLKKDPNDGIIKQIYGAMYGDDSELREAACFTLWEICASDYKLPHPTQYGYG